MLVLINLFRSLFLVLVCLSRAEQSRAEQSSFRAGPPGPPGSTSDLGGYVDTSPPGHTCQKRDPKEGVFLRTNIYPGGPGGRARNEEEEEGEGKGDPKRAGAKQVQWTSDERRATSGRNGDGHG